MATRPAPPKAAGWILGTIVLALLLGVGSWFLAISPVMTETAETQEQATSTRDSNTILRSKIARLAEEFTHLDEYKAELAALQTQIPTDAQMAEYLRQVQTLATARGVTITGTTAELGQTVIPAVTLEQAAAAAEAAAAPAPAAGAEGDKAADAATTEAEKEPATPPGFVAIPLSVTVLGSYENVVAFVGDLQNSTARLFLVTSFVGTAQDEAEAAGGRPATAVGDVEIVVTGYTYVLKTLLPAAPVSAVEVAPAPLPVPPPGRNPLVPVGG